MSHEVESVAYNGKVPWHGIGFQLNEAPTPQKMLEAANLDWTVNKRPMFTCKQDDYIDKPIAYDLLIPNLYALVRNSDQSVFGVCGPKYQPFQNSEVFDFFNKFTEAGHMKMEVAGSLRGGKWVWALARLEGPAFTLMKNDPNYSFLLLVSPHIWGEALNIMFTSVRVVCWNTLTQAMEKNVVNKFRFIHSRSFSDIREIAEISVEQAMIQKAVYEQKAKLLAEAPVVDMSKLYKYIMEVLNPKHDGSEVLPTELTRTGDQLLLNFHTCPGSNLVSANNTWWGAFNAVTYFFDHQYGRQGPDKRLYEAWLSHINAVKKRRAFDLAVMYANAA